MAIDTFEDVLHALRTHPEWLEELRALMFTDGLLTLPATVAEQGRVQAEQGRTLLTIQETIAEMGRRLDDAVGYITEERYRNKAYGYFGTIAKRIRQLAGPDLDDVLEPMEAAGTLDDRGRLEVLAADGIFEGRRGGQPVRLVLEASLVVHIDDVTRARDRARLLEPSGVAVLGIAAGKAASSPARRAARKAGVWIVTNGRPEAPEVVDPDAA